MNTTTLPEIQESVFVPMHVPRLAAANLTVYGWIKTFAWTCLDKSFAAQTWQNLSKTGPSFDSNRQVVAVKDSWWHSRMFWQSYLHCQDPPTTSLHEWQRQHNWWCEDWPNPLLLWSHWFSTPYPNHLGHTAPCRRRLPWNGMSGIRCNQLMGCQRERL